LLRLAGSAGAAGRDVASNVSTDAVDVGLLSECC